MSKLQNFDYQNVALKEGHWKKQRDELIETYLKIEDDDLLHPFRKLANLPNKGHGLVGWYGSGASTFGQKLGAFAKLYLVTGDIRLKEKAIRLADGWGECLAASDSVADCNGTYNYDKLMGGFLDLYEYLGSEPAKEYVRARTKSADARPVPTNRACRRTAMAATTVWDAYAKTVAMRRLKQNRKIRRRKRLPRRRWCRNLPLAHPPFPDLITAGWMRQR